MSTRPGSEFDEVFGTTPRRPEVEAPLPDQSGADAKERRDTAQETIPIGDRPSARGETPRDLQYVEVNDKPYVLTGDPSRDLAQTSQMRQQLEQTLAAEEAAFQRADKEFQRALMEKARYDPRSFQNYELQYMQYVQSHQDNVGRIRSAIGNIGEYERGLSRVQSGGVDPIEELAGIKPETRGGAVAAGGFRPSEPIIVRNPIEFADVQTQERADRPRTLIAPQKPSGRPIPGPAAGPRPGSVGAGIQGGFSFIGGRIEDAFTGAESWLGGLSTEKRGEAARLKARGENIGAGLFFASSGALKAGEGFLAGASFLIRPKRWVETGEGLLSLATNGETRGRAVAGLLSDPYGAVTYGAGSLLGGYSAGKAIQRIIPPKVTVKETISRVPAREYKYRVGDEPLYKWSITREKIPIVKEDFSSGHFLVQEAGYGQWPKSGRVGLGSTKGYAQTGGDLVPLLYEPEGAVSEVLRFSRTPLRPTSIFDPGIRLPNLLRSTVTSVRPRLRGLGGVTGVLGVSQLASTETLDLLQPKTRVSSSQRVKTESAQRTAIEQRNRKLLRDVNVQKSELGTLQLLKTDTVTIQKQRLREESLLSLRTEEKQTQENRRLSPLSLRIAATRSPMIQPFELTKRKPRKRKSSGLFGKEQRKYRLLDPEDVLGV